MLKVVALNQGLYPLLFPSLPFPLPSFFPSLIPLFSPPPSLPFPTFLVPSFSPILCHSLYIISFSSPYSSHPLPQYSHLPFPNPFSISLYALLFDLSFSLYIHCHYSFPFVSHPCLSSTSSLPFPHTILCFSVLPLLLFPSLSSPLPLDNFPPLLYSSLHLSFSHFFLVPLLTFPLVILLTLSFLLSPPLPNSSLSFSYIHISYLPSLPYSSFPFLSLPKYSLSFPPELIPPLPVKLFSPLPDSSPYTPFFLSLESFCTMPTQYVMVVTNHCDVINSHLLQSQ